ncbi:Muscle, skeletal receptor tyrosine protein kinase [Rhizoctonia solani]|uniref:Muscle, skeletal receptor tyrosine protein kinase n=1 Tax=Rhizoctonia solani TaxID=456999 RepID=A0A0K6G4F1_9AGAM|nr:Muscle, skeletal receptor tyrosine protein kinase [Rhizoctonia solani]
MNEDNTWNGTNFTSLMDELINHSLLDLPQPGGLYSIPPCLHAIITEALTEDRQFFCRVATHLLALSIDSTRDDYEELAFRRQISAHVNSVLIQGENISLDEAARFVLVYMVNGQLEEAETLQLEVVEFRKRMLGENHHLTLEGQERLDTIYSLQGKIGPDTHFDDEDSFTPLPYSQLLRRPRITQNRISVSLQRITANTPLNDIVKHFTLVAHLRDLTHELGPCLETRTSWGGLGDVYRTVMRDGTEIAIKTLRPSRSKSDNKITKYTAREIAAWSKLDHPNILEFLGLAVFQNQLVMVSPWMHCGNVVEFAKQRGVNRCSLCLQLSSAVAYMHSMRVVHGDIKGANTLVSEDGVVKLTDFGLTIVQEPDVYISITEKGGGTERWMAPELLLEDTAVRSEKADVYALGMTFLEVFTGLPPYSNVRRNCAVVAMIARGEKVQYPEDLSLYTRHSDRVWNILQQCWQWKPRERPTAEQIKATFYEIM